MEYKPRKDLQLLILLILNFETIQAAKPSFITPDPYGGTSPRNVYENCGKDRSVLTIEGQDTDGDRLSFSILSQHPISPPFELNTTSGEFKTPDGLDAEFSQNYTFRFGVSDGGPTVPSVYFTLNIIDLNDNPPVFTDDPFSFTVSDTDEEVDLFEKVVGEVTAKDRDVSSCCNKIEYRDITDRNSSEKIMFSVDQSTGKISISTHSRLGGGYLLKVKATDGIHTISTTVNIKVAETSKSSVGVATKTTSAGGDFDQTTFAGGDSDQSTPSSGLIDLHITNQDEGISIALLGTLIASLFSSCLILSLMLYIGRHRKRFGGLFNKKESEKCADALGDTSKELTPLQKSTDGPANTYKEMVTIHYDKPEKDGQLGILLEL